MDERLVASRFVTCWGSIGFFGPLTVHPDYWGQGIAQRQMVPTMDLFAKWHTTHEALFTFSENGKHIALYQKFRFWPRFLTAIMASPVEKHRVVRPHAPKRFEALLDACEELAYSRGFAKMVALTWHARKAVA